MPNHRNRFPARRRFLKQTAALSARAASIGTTGLLLAGAASGAERSGADEVRQLAATGAGNHGRPVAPRAGVPAPRTVADGSSANAAGGSTDAGGPGQLGATPAGRPRAGAGR
jgi:hypothetical protein